MFCPNCGNKLEDGDIYWVHCGLKVPKEPVAEETVLISKSEIQNAQQQAHRSGPQASNE